MKCRVCGREVGNSFQLVCDGCTRAEEEYERRLEDEQSDEEEGMEVKKQ